MAAVDFSKLSTNLQTHAARGQGLLPFWAAPNLPRWLRRTLSWPTCPQHLQQPKRGAVGMVYGQDISVTWPQDGQHQKLTEMSSVPQDVRRVTPYAPPIKVSNVSARREPQTSNRTFGLGGCRLGGYWGYVMRCWVLPSP